MQQTDESIHRYLAENDFRLLDPLEQAVRLVEEKICGQRQAVRVCKVKRTALQRALQASKEGRPVGVPGCSKSLTFKKEEQLVKEIDDADLRRKPLTFNQFQERYENTFYI